MWRGGEEGVRGGVCVWDGGVVRDSRCGGGVREGGSGVCVCGGGIWRADADAKRGCGGGGGTSLQ
eukprot:1159415-Rhodomonas_salina.3